MLSDFHFPGGYVDCCARIIADSNITSGQSVKSSAFPDIRAAYKEYFFDVIVISLRLFLFFISIHNHTLS